MRIQDQMLVRLVVEDLIEQVLSDDTIHQIVNITLIDDANQHVLCKASAVASVTIGITNLDCKDGHLLAIKQPVILMFYWPMSADRLLNHVN